MSEANNHIFGSVRGQQPHIWIDINLRSLPVWIHTTNKSYKSGYAQILMAEDC
jgi:hypothetical protein